MKKFLISTMSAVLLLGSCAAFFEGDEGVRDLPDSIKPLKLQEIKTPFTHQWDDENSYHFVGSATIDIDGDGRFEVFLGGGLGQDDMLLAFENGTLVNKIVGTGLSSKDATYGATAIDVDNDGRVDLITMRDHGMTIYYAKGQGRFEPQQVRLNLPKNSVALNATPIDIEQDGDIDLYISVFINSSNFRSVTYNDPTQRRYNIMLRNDGNRRFKDITDAVTRGQQNSFTAIAVDLNQDHKQDLIVMQNTGQVEILHNLGKGKFVRAALDTGFGFWMGGGIGDIDNDGDVDMVFSNSGSSIPDLILMGDLKKGMRFNDSWLMLRNDGNFRFTDISKAAGVSELGFGWGVVLEDMNYDGAVDMFCAQNYVNWPLHYVYKVDNKIMLNDPKAPPSFYGLDVHVGRNHHFGHTPLLTDLDGDSKTDLLWVNANGPLKAFLNKTEGNYLSVRVPDNVLSLGAVFEIVVGNKTYRRQMTSAQGLTTDQPPIVTFGLGDATAVRSLKIRWSNGAITKRTNPPINRVLFIQP